MNRIKDLRTERKWTQTALGSKLDMAHQQISKYETGVLDLDTDTIRRLCEIFGVTSDYLLGISAQRTRELTEGEYAIVAAYRAADPHTRELVDLALRPYAEADKKDTAAG